MIKASIISGMSIVSGIALSYVGSLVDSSKTMAIGAAIATGSTGVYAIANHKLNNDKFVKRIKNHRESAHNEEYKKLKNVPRHGSTNTYAHSVRVALMTHNSVGATT